VLLHRGFCREGPGYYYYYYNYCYYYY
jgi:hypothetical protein